MSDIPVLTEHAAEVTPGEKHGPAAVHALDARLLAEMRRDRRHPDRVRGDHAVARPLVAVHPAQPRAQVAVAQVRVRRGPLLRGDDRGHGGVAREVGGVIEEERWC